MFDEASASPAAPGLPHVAGLNDAQAAAVETLDGPLLVLAGAGTGKTRVLTSRLAHILATGRARPWQVLAVTFTNKAAREMRERVAGLLGCSVEGWWVGTFHATGARILRAHAERVGLKPSFTILDTDDQLRLIKQLLEARNLDTKKTPPRLIAAVIQRWKDRGLAPAQVSANDKGGDGDSLAHDLYGEYQQRLTQLNAVDFGDLLLHCLTLFQTDAEILARYQNQFRYILVDEYQDTNVAQYLWLRALARAHHNICCVGDDDQSIYSWRGAEIANILRFETDFPGARVVRLECNYRSTAPILAAASGLIAHNQARLGKTLYTEQPGGDPVVIRAVWDGEDEARTVAELIDIWRGAQQPLNQMAILVRAGFQTREFEERMVTTGIPYRVIGGARFYERQEIRDAIAYFRIVVEPSDDLAFERIVNTPKRGLGTQSLRSIHLLARAQGLPLTLAAARLAETDELKPQARRSIVRLLDDIARWRSRLDTLPHPEVASLILDESGYTAMWQADTSPEAAGRLDNLKELVAALGDFENMVGFLEHVSLVLDTEGDAGDDRVSIMTMHAAKGLEFDAVFLPGWEEGLFPNGRALDEGGASALEEERRLAYVALTRARRRLVILHAANRMTFGFWQTAQPSRFIAELPAEAVRSETARGLFPAQTAHRSRGFADFASGSAASRLNAARPSTVASRAPLTIDGSARRIDPPAAAQRFAVGARVFHQKFGYGMVRAADGNTLDIEFDKAGRKTVVESFVEPAAAP